MITKLVNELFYIVHMFAGVLLIFMSDVTLDIFYSGDQSAFLSTIALFISGILILVRVVRNG